MADLLHQVGTAQTSSNITLDWGQGIQILEPVGDVVIQTTPFLNSTTQGPKPLTEGSYWTFQLQTLIIVFRNAHCDVRRDG